jgi:hypothetical protein
MKRRIPAIYALVKQYNALCEKIAILSSRLKRPVLPKPIDKTEIFAMDMDDDIW